MRIMRRDTNRRPLATLMGFIVALGITCSETSALAIPQQTPSDYLAAPPQNASASPPAAAGSRTKASLNLFQLLVSGGWFMIPLGALSLAVVAIAVERGLALRRRRLLPDDLLEGIVQMSRQEGGLDPRAAYRICQTFPSAASQVLRAVLSKVGRPHAELETALRETSQRSATRLHQPVSWLNLIAAIAPLLGLLGTVWGITQAFYDTTQMQVGDNRAEALAAGIYMALVTTIFGLTIALPAAVLAHFYENKIVRHHCEIEDMISSLLPQLERFEGQVRFLDAPATWRETWDSHNSGKKATSARRGAQQERTAEGHSLRPATTERRE